MGDDNPEGAGGAGHGFEFIDDTFGFGEGETFEPGHVTGGRPGAFDFFAYDVVGGSGAAEVSEAGEQWAAEEQSKEGTLFHELESSFLNSSMLRS